MKGSDLERKDLDIGLLDPNPNNPNTMTAKGFNLLVDNIKRVGFTDPILVKIHTKNDEIRYRVIGGHHRLEAAKYLDYTQVPCTIVTSEDFTEDEESFQLMRHNLIRGKLNPEKFVKLYESLQVKYSNEALVEAFGFEESSELEKMIKTTEKGLPAEFKEKFKEGVKEVKSIKDLGALLNRLFNDYGDTIPYGFMFLDFGGKNSVWLRMLSQDMENFKKVSELCISEKKSVDSLMRVILQLIAKKELPKVLEVLSCLPSVELISKSTNPPTEELLSMLPD